jgi:hypothetical protein
MAFFVDIRNLKRIKRIQVEKTIFCGLSILFVITNKKKLNSIRYCDSRFHSSNLRMICECDSIDLRLGSYPENFSCKKIDCVQIKKFKKINNNFDNNNFDNNNKNCCCLLGSNGRPWGEIAQFFD